MCENWKQIEGYEGLYQVNVFGDVYSCKNKKQLHPALSNGYNVVLLYKNGKVKLHSVHRLVAKAFIPNPDNLLIVNHIDGNKTNNHVSNLEWCTQKQNVQHCIAMGQFSKMKGRIKKEG